MIQEYMDTVEPEESDEEDDPEPLRTFRVEVVMDNASRIVGKPNTDPSIVIICGTGPACAFMTEALTLGKPLPWCLREETDSVKYRFPPPPKSPRFYSPEGTERCVVILLEEPVAVELAHAWTEALFEGLGGCPTVVFLDTLLLSTWKSLDDLQPKPEEPRLFSLHTPSWDAHRSTQIEQLPIPNVVEGICAAILTRCHIRGQQCLVALALQDGAHAGSRTLEGFSGLQTVFKDSDIGVPLSAKLDYEAMEKGVREAAGLSIYA